MSRFNNYISAKLEHIKVHKPLIQPPATNVITNINNMIRNNISFSINIQLKNRMISPSFYPLANVAESSGQDYYSQLPFEKYGLIINDYEWYLHTSRLKGIYNMQKQFISIMNSRQTAQSSFMELLQNSSQYDTNTYTGFSQSGAAPAIYYITPKPEAQAPSVETRTTNINSTVQNDIQKHINTEHTKQENTVIQSINIDYVVDKAVKTLEDKLRFEKLKKGW